MEKKGNSSEISQRAQELYGEKKYYEYAQHVKSLCKRKITSNNLEVYTKLLQIAINELSSADQVLAANCRTNWSSTWRSTTSRTTTRTRKS